MDLCDCVSEGECMYAHVVCWREEGGNEQNPIIYLKIIVKIFGFQTICPALAINVALESEDSLEHNFFLFRAAQSLYSGFQLIGEGQRT